MSSTPRQTPRPWLGAAILLLIAAGATATFLLDGIVARFRSTYTIIAVVRQAPDLAQGSRVWLSGRDVGEVSTVGFLPMRGDSVATIALTLTLPTTVQQHVRRDSRVRVTSNGLIGESVIDILAGTAASPPLAPGDTLRQRESHDAEEVTRRAVAFRASLDSALAEFRALQGPIEQRMHSFQLVQRQLAGAQQEYAAIMADLQRNPGLALLSDGRLSQAMVTGRAAVGELLHAIENLQQNAAHSGFTASAQSLRASAERLRASLAGLELQMQAQGGGSLERFSRDSALVRAIGAARAELDSLLADARRHPFRYVF